MAQVAVKAPSTEVRRGLLQAMVPPVRYPVVSHGLSSNTLALITSRCGTMRSLRIKWP